MAFSQYLDLVEWLEVTESELVRFDVDSCYSTPQIPTALTCDYLKLAGPLWGLSQKHSDGMSRQACVTSLTTLQYTCAWTTGLVTGFATGPVQSDV